MGMPFVCLDGEKKMERLTGSSQTPGIPTGEIWEHSKSLEGTTNVELREALLQECLILTEQLFQNSFSKLLLIININEIKMHTPPKKKKKKKKKSNPPQKKKKKKKKKK